MLVKLLTSLIICIIAHEAGHCIVAKMCKCVVEVFSIGFGRPLIKIKMGSTVYQLTPFILGGFCKLKGESVLTRSKYAFINMTYGKKMLIIYAGCFVNIVMGIVAFSVGKYFNCYNLLYFGWLSTLLGISNMIPFPALDGSFPILLGLLKIYGKKKGIVYMNKIVKIGFIILMIVNIACIPYLFYLLKGNV